MIREAMEKVLRLLMWGERARMGHVVQTGGEEGAAEWGKREGEWYGDRGGAGWGLCNLDSVSGQVAVELWSSRYARFPKSLVK